MRPLIQSAVNLSEGRRRDVIAAIVDAAASPRGAPPVVADWSADPDHNRMVVTLLGGPDAVRAGVLAVARAAVERIDLRHHEGAHPRIGAVDVVPLTPLRDIEIGACVDLSKEIAEDLSRELELPVFLYEASAARATSAAGREALPEIRKGGFEGLAGRMLNGLSPDFGPPAPHPTAGAAVVGARGPLVAWNVDLDTTAGEAASVAAARAVAGALRAARASDVALAGVRALGLWLPTQQRAQVSMNLTRPDSTPMPALFDRVCAEARARGAEPIGSELIGLVPAKALGGEPPERILWRNARETQLVEYWLARL